MKDILEELRALIGDQKSTDGAGTAVTFALLCRAADEIAWLRSIAGTVSDGRSMADIKVAQRDKFPHVAWGPNGAMTQAEYDAYMASAGRLQSMKNP